MTKTHPQLFCTAFSGIFYHTYFHTFLMIAMATDATAIQSTLCLRQNFDAFDSTKLVAIASVTLVMAAMGDGDQK